METPGHTVGSICILMGNVMFSGDTLFRMSIGRSDLPTGSFDEIINSIKKLYDLKKIIEYYLVTVQRVIYDLKRKIIHL